MPIKRKLEENAFKEQSGRAIGFTVIAFLLYLSIYFNMDDSCAHLRIKNQTRVGSNEWIQKSIGRNLLQLQKACVIRLTIMDSVSEEGKTTFGNPRPRSPSHNPAPKFLCLHHIHTAAQLVICLIPALTTSEFWPQTLINLFGLCTLKILTFSQASPTAEVSLAERGQFLPDYLGI